MAAYWIKMYQEVLDDPKMGRLSDRCWRRFFELCLVASRYARDGLLPSIEDTAWQCHITTEMLAEDMAVLSERGLITVTDDETTVTNFAKRQAPNPDAERKAAQRHRSRIGHENVTNVSRNVSRNVRELDIDIDTDKSTDKDKELDLEIEPNEFKQADKLADQIARMTGIMPSPMDSQVLDDMVKTGATEQDIASAIAWYTSQGKTVRSVRALAGPVAFAISKRIQSRVKTADTPTDRRKALASSWAEYIHPDGDEYTEPFGG